MVTQATVVGFSWKTRLEVMHETIQYCEGSLLDLAQAAMAVATQRQEPVWGDIWLRDPGTKIFRVNATPDTNSALVSGIQGGAMILVVMGTSIVWFPTVKDVRRMLEGLPPLGY